MPGGDGTGPMGWGPRSGRAAGYCPGYRSPGYANPFPGRRFWGYSFQRPQFYRENVADEKTALQQRAEFLKEHPGCIRAVCLSDKRGVPKYDIGKGYLKEDFGLLGDAHAGTGEKQVSILLAQYVEPLVEILGRMPAPGSFAENLLVNGLSECGLTGGTLLKAGEAVIEITAIGKDAAERHTYSYEGFSLLADQGLFGRVIKGGRIKVGDFVELQG